MSGKIDKKQINQRSSVVAKINDSIAKQIEKLNEYFNLSKREEEAISNNEFDKFPIYMQRENDFIHEINNHQKIIDALIDQYGKILPEIEESIKVKQENIESLKKKVLFLNKQNRQILRKKMIEMERELKSIKKNPVKSSPFKKIGKPSLIDIKT